MLLVPALAMGVHAQTAASPRKKTAAPLSHRADVSGRRSQGARRRHQEKGEREQRVGRSALTSVVWNADETKTFCLYEAPSEAAVRKAAELD